MASTSPEEYAVLSKIGDTPFMRDRALRMAASTTTRPRVAFLARSVNDLLCQNGATFGETIAALEYLLSRTRAELVKSACN